jgi:hypothetical protein
MCPKYLRKGSKQTTPKRVTIAVADCGLGITQHIGQAYPDVLNDTPQALSLAMRPGITGARKSMYGSSDNAGAGLFITRAIAKATGGYFVLLSGNAAFRLKRCKHPGELRVFWDPFDEPKHELFTGETPWQGTVAGVEVVTDQVGDFDEFFKWIRQQLPAKKH